MLYCLFNFMLCYGLDHDLNPTKFSACFYACFYACFTLEFNPEDDMEKMKKIQEDLTTLKRKSKTANPLKKKKLQKIRGCRCSSFYCQVAAAHTFSRT